MVATTSDGSEQDLARDEAATTGWSRAVRGQAPGLGRKLMRRMMRTIDRWSLVEPGDRILVAVSGGKDSYTLLDLLWLAKQRAPFDFDIVAVHLDQVQPDYDGHPLADWLRTSGVPFEVLREDTYSIVKANTKPGQAYCFLCSRLRRGILYSTAERLGCNKLAFGHHRDDALETLLMNMCFSGRMQAMPARYTTDDERFVVIRPLIETSEDEIARYAEARAFPILPCNLCGNQEGLQRDEMRALLKSLEERIPDVRNVMLQSLRNVRPSHLLDTDLARAWDERPTDVRPWTPGKKGTRQTVPEVVARSGSLPIVD
jgi:tRNA 2-thiocytidine biosynthesis protein TtcA